MKRRALLASAGVGVTSLTGCLFGGGGGGSEQETTAQGTQPLQDVDKTGSELSLVSISAPEEVQVNQEYAFTFSVKNAGDTAGVYRAPVSVQREGQVEFEQEATALVYVEPGETQTASISISRFKDIGRANVRLDGAANQWGIKITRRRLPFGGTYNSRNIAVTVDQVELAPQTRGGDNSQWAYVYVRARSTNEQNYAPPPKNFYVVYNGARYEKVLYGTKTPEYNNVIIREGQTEAGIIQFSIPKEATVADLTVEYERRNQQAVWLRPEGSDSGSSGSTDDSGGN